MAYQIVEEVRWKIESLSPYPDDVQPSDYGSTADGDYYRQSRPRFLKFEAENRSENDPADFPIRSRLHAMSQLPPSMRRLGVKEVVVIREEASDAEVRFEVEAHIQPETGFFPVDTPIYEGDIVEFPDTRGGTTRKTAAGVKVYDVGSPSMHHTEVEWGDRPSAVRTAAVRRIGLEGLHPEVIRVANDMFTDGHYSQSIFEALKALERRVRTQSGLDLSGRDLMAQAFSSNPALIDMAVEQGQSGRDEQEGFRFIFMGVIQGIRNPKGHELVEQDDPQRALEYLALVSVLFRRLDDAKGNGT
ncbi:MAG: TIGR02391 family protein [Acidimicrobiia bacterium]